MRRTVIYRLCSVVIALAALLSSFDASAAKSREGQGHVPSSRTTRAKTGRGKTSKIALQSLRGKIVFMHDQALWYINPDGSGQQRILPRLFASATGNRAVALTPDGTRILYVHNPGNPNKFKGEELFSIRFDGTGRCRLTNTNYSLVPQEPQFSPDGRQIVYTRSTGSRWGGPGDSDAEIRLMNADGSDDHHLAGDLNTSDQNHLSPLWSRDGKRILFTRTEGCIDYASAGTVKYKQRVININGTGERDLGDNWRDFAADFSSPDGKQQVITKGENNIYGAFGSGELYLRNIDGSDLRRLTIRSCLRSVSEVKWELRTS